MSLIKKFILTALLAHISDALFRTRTKTIVQAQVDTPTPDIDPPVATAQAIIVNLDKAFQKRETLKDEQLQNTAEITALKKKLSDLIVDNWMPTIQIFCDGDEALAKSLGFGIKGEYDGSSDSPVSITNSYPSIVNVITSTHLQLTVDVENSVNKKIIPPGDAKGVDVYMYVGDIEPAGHFKAFAQYSGRVANGKCTCHFTEAQVGKSVWLYACYVPKKPNIGLDLCGKVKSMVV